LKGPEDEVKGMVEEETTYSEFEKGIARRGSVGHVGSRIGQVRSWRLNDFRVGGNDVRGIAFELVVKRIRDDGGLVLGNGAGEGGPVGSLRGREDAGRMYVVMREEHRTRYQR
jgi:hypothetical protein